LKKGDYYQEMELSPEQNLVFEFAKNDERSLIVNSTAGSGKSTTLLHAVIPGLIHKGLTYEEILVLMFNKAVQVEFESKARLLNIYSKISTFHAFGFSLLRENFNTRMDKDKLKKLAESLKITNYEIHKLVTLAKTEGMNLVKEWDGSLLSWNQLCDNYSFELERSEIEQARRLFDASISSFKTCDFSDMVYGPVKEKLLSSAKVVALDECQDCGLLRLEFLRTVFKNTTVYAVGDPQQSIFGFAGSDEYALDKIQSHFKAHTLPLNVSWRCSAAVTHEANKIVPHMRCRANAPQGVVEHIDVETFDSFPFSQNETFILCRLNYPLLGVLFSLLSRNFRCRIQGKDFGEELITMTKKWKWSSFYELKLKLEKFLEKQRAKLLPENPRTFKAISDKIDVINLLLKKCIEVGRTEKEDFPFFVREIFKDDGDGIVLSTVHRVKGLEKKDVFLYGFDRYKANWIRQEWEKREENRIKFVAITRAKENLYYVDLKEEPENKESKKKQSYSLPQKSSGTYKNGFKHIAANSDSTDF